MLSLVTAAIFHESTYRKVPPAHDTMVSALLLPASSRPHPIVPRPHSPILRPLQRSFSCSCCPLFHSLSLLPLTFKATFQDPYNALSLAPATPLLMPFSYCPSLSELRLKTSQRPASCPCCPLSHALFHTALHYTVTFQDTHKAPSLALHSAATVPGLTTPSLLLQALLSITFHSHSLVSRPLQLRPLPFSLSLTRSSSFSSSCIHLLVLFPAFVAPSPCHAPCPALPAPYPFFSLPRLCPPLPLYSSATLNLRLIGQLAEATNQRALPWVSPIHVSFSMAASLLVEQIADLMCIIQ